jgi:transcription elongation factor Elf1
MNPFEQTTDEPTNEERAGRIDTVMQAYCLTLEGRDFDGDEDDVKDLLADLMHFCKRMEIDFEENLRVARNNYKHEWDAENGTPNNLVCPVCGSFLEVSRTDTLLGIDREIFDCQSCDETFIRELTVADSPIERAVKCIGCGDMTPLSSSRIFYQSDGYAHYIGECCWDERLRG